MAMSHDVKQKIFEFLPEEYVAEAPFVDGRYKPPGATHKQNAQWWSQQDDGFIFFALHEDFIQLDLKTIKKIAIVTGTQLDPEDDEYPEDQQNAILDNITSHVSTETLRQITEGTWGGHDQSQQISTESTDESTTVDELWVESERIARRVMLLKNRKSKSTTAKPVAVWNSNLATKWEAGPWIRIDMRHHPNEKLRADGVLVVHVDHRNQGNSWAKLKKGGSLTVEKKEKALYGAEEVDYPCLEVLGQKASKKIRNAMNESPQACDEYEQGYWDECFPRDMYSHTNVHAQLGGWPITWPDEGADEQLDRQLVLRTYADSEPWIEVFRKGRSFQVVERIT